MNKNIASSIATLLLAGCFSTLSAADFGYCTNSIDRSHLFSIGTTTKQGLAIRLSPEKIAMLRGCTINTISATFGSKRMTDGAISLFIATDPDAPLVTQKATVSSATKWLTFNLDKPYTISGDEPCLFIGYTGEISVGSNMLMADFTADSRATTFAYKDGDWVDLYGMGYGSASIRFGIADAPAVTDLMLKPLSVDGYFKAGQNYTLDGQVFNFGTESISSFDLMVEAEGQQAVTTCIRDVAINPGEVFDFTIPDWGADSEGVRHLSIQITNVNGGADTDDSDNLFASNVYLYPSDMERTFLLEGFTGQACGNCPAGHSVINKFMQESTTPVIEVMHHSGYQPDNFSMDADYDYTYFYGSANTFAPAAMLNRTTFEVLGSVPVMNTSEPYLQYASAMLEKTQPYASLALESNFDTATRQLNVSLTTYAHTDLPSAMNVINVMLIQDGLVANQSSGGTNYIHNAVFRGALTGNAWGVLIDDDATRAGGSFTWTKTLTLPEAIFSDFYNPETLTDSEIAKCTWPAIPENMKIVAFVAAYGDTPSDHAVYNAVEVPLGGSHVQGAFPTAIEPLAAEQPHIAVRGGRIVVEGEFDTINIYNLNGLAVSPDTQLSNGVYIVKVRKGNTTNTAKICVR